MPASIRLLIAASFALVAALGCSSAPPSQLNISSKDGGALFTQAFPTGVADVQDAGDMDLVVHCRTNAKLADAPAVEQVLHVRMLWQQGYAVKAQMREVSQNAALHWYVYPAGRTDLAGRPQVLEYTGTGLVEVSRAGNLVRLKIIDATLRPTMLTGGMADPLGPATLSGTLVAQADHAQAALALSDLHATVAAAKQSGGTAEAKLPMGP